MDKGSQGSIRVWKTDYPDRAAVQAFNGHKYVFSTNTQNDDRKMEFCFERRRHKFYVRLSVGGKKIEEKHGKNFLWLLYPEDSQLFNDFMKNVFDKRQLGYKVTANSIYGQTGAKTSSFYEPDVAASTTATGRKLLYYGKRIIEEVYGDKICDTPYGKVHSHAEYIYGDTDSVFMSFKLTDLEGNPIVGKEALKITIDLAKEAGELATEKNEIL